METKIITLKAEKRNGRIVYHCQSELHEQRWAKKHCDPFALSILVLELIALAILFVVSMFRDGEQRTLDATQQSTNEPIVATLESVVIPDGAPERIQWTCTDIELLALVIYQEAGGDMCSDTTRQMVGEVVLNRVADARFPNTLEEVLTQKQQYGCLYWTGLVWPDRASKPEEAYAVERAYDISETLLTSTDRLLPSDVVFQAEFRQGSETIAESDGFYFCR